MLNVEVTFGTCTQFQKPTLNCGCLGDKFTALENGTPVESVSNFVNDVTIILCGRSHMHPFQTDTSMKALLHQIAADIKSFNTKVDALLGQKVSLNLIVFL